MSRFIRFMMPTMVGMMLTVAAVGQSYNGQVLGTLSGAVHKYSGEFTDDLWGPGAFLSLQYAPIARLQIEGRFGLGEIRWKTTPADIAAYPDYFGQGAEYGDPYPGTLTQIEPENESRLTTIDLLVNYVIVDHLPAVPFISAGVGWTSFAPSTAENHDALPNFGANVYSGSTFSIPLGAGVRIPFSDRVGLLLRGEYRFVFSEYLDDFSANGSNDAVTSISVGLTYSFTDRGVRRRPMHHSHMGDHACGCCGMERGHHDECPCSASSEPDADAPAPSAAPSGATTAPAATAPATAAPATAAPATTAPTTTAPAGTAPATTAPATAPATATAPDPCPAGSARLCVDDDLSVCVDTNFTPGRGRIKWEEGMIFDPGNPGHGQLLSEVGGATPCYANVVRESDNAYYLCVDCCFERQESAGYVLYKLMGEGRIVKGQGSFDPAECPDCRTVAAQGR